MNEFIHTNLSLNFSVDCIQNETIVNVLNERKETNDTSSFNLQFNKNTLTIIVYVVLFFIAAIGNLTVVVSLLKSRYRKSRISLMILHLAIADSMVTFIMIPLEIGWRVTVQWLAGNAACKAFLFLRAFGLYLSSNVLICVSLDRYFAVLHPLRVNDARRRGKLMLICAWSVSLFCSAPQSVVFHVSPHPEYPTFYQCVSFGFFTTSQEIAYNLFCLMGLYFVPLFVIIVAYTKILWEIFKKSKETNNEEYQTSKGRMLLRRSDISNIERARSRTLKMTITIVGVFILCWTPYVVMTLWYMFDRDSAAKLSSWLQDLFFMMAVSNSCMNPLVYGSYAMNLRKECWTVCCLNKNNSQMNIGRRENVLSGAAGQGNGLTQRINKYFNTLKKVGSGATRSTAVVQGMNIARFPINTSKKPVPRFKNVNPLERPSSIGQIAFLSEPLNEHGCRTTFHSEPCPYIENEHIYNKNTGKVEDII